MEPQTQGWEKACERARQGKHSVLLGAAGEGFGAGPALLLVRIDCDSARGPMSVVLEAERRIAAALGEEPEPSALDVAAKRVIAGLRRHLLGEGEPPSSRGEPLAGALARLRRKHSGAVVVLFFAADAADAASLEYLAALVRRGGVPVPCAFALRALEPLGGAADLVAAVRESAGEEALIACASHPAPEVSAAALGALPTEVRRTLRAAATVGAAFEAGLLAELLDTEAIEVLEHLQHARDLGVPIEDRGNGRLALAPSVLEALRAHTLPSLAAAWHRRLAAILARSEDDLAPATLRDRSGRRVGAGRSAEGAVRGRAAGPSGLAATGGMAAPTGALGPPGSLLRASLAQPPLPNIVNPNLDTGAEGFDLTPERPPPARQSEPRMRPSDVTRLAGQSVGRGRPFDALAGEDDLRPGGLGARDDDRASGPVGADVPSQAPIAAVPPVRAPRSIDPIDGPAPADGAAAFGEVPPPSPSVSELFDVRARDGATAPRPGLPLEQFLHRLADAGERSPSDGPRLTSVAPPAPRDRSRWLMKEAPRAADHAAAAGDVDTAAALLVRAASEHAVRGMPEQAHDLAGRAVRLLEEVPQTRARRRLTSQALLEVGRCQTVAGDDGTKFRLTEAVKTLEVAQTIARELGDADLQAECGQAIASACYDIGAADTLERALTELTDASRLLLNAGKSLEAARLLNDEAAVWVRLGDPVRAHHLLKKSREVFARLTDQHPPARREMAETDHLLARLVLHVAPRPGRQIDAADVALRHAHAAAEAYADLGETRELARVWETMGRLELMAGRPDEAATELVRAIEMQQRTSDVVGLARSTAAFADVMLERGDVRRALVALADSIALNRDKGARLGLAHNRAALERLASAAGDESPQISALRRELAAAEAELVGGERA